MAKCCACWYVPSEGNNVVKEPQVHSAPTNGWGKRVVTDQAGGVRDLSFADDINSEFADDLSIMR